MGSRGPKPDSHRLVEVEGLSEKRPAPFSGMTVRAKRTWRSIVANLPPTHFRTSDLPLFRAYCEAEALHFEATKGIAKEGAVVTQENFRGKEYTKANPWVAIQTQTAHTMAQLATKLRLCVSTRLSAWKAASAKTEPVSKRKDLMFGGQEK